MKIVAFLAALVVAALTTPAAAQTPACVTLEVTRSWTTDAEREAAEIALLRTPVLFTVVRGTGLTAAAVLACNSGVPAERGLEVRQGPGEVALFVLQQNGAAIFNVPATGGLILVYSGICLSPGNAVLMERIVTLPSTGGGTVSVLLERSANPPPVNPAECPR